MYIPEGVKIVNLTPHEVNLMYEPINPDGSGSGVYLPLHTFQPSGDVARVSAKTVSVGEFYGIPITSTQFGEVEGLPEPKKGTIYIVSSLVAQCVQSRGDVFIPNESVRGSEGRIIGCKSLGHI